MTDVSEISPSALLRIMTFLSPAFPTGGFAYSGGLESAVKEGLVDSHETLTSWLRKSLTNGPLWNDAVLCAAAWNSEPEADQLALALAGSCERYEETCALGGAFRTAAQAWNSNETQPLTEPVALPIAIGFLAREQSLPLVPLLVGFLQSGVSNQVQAALRLFDLGQQAGLRVTHELEPDLLKTASAAADSSLDNLGSATVMIDVASMRHESQTSRIFRS